MKRSFTLSSLRKTNVVFLPNYPVYVTDKICKFLFLLKFRVWNANIQDKIKHSFITLQQSSKYEGLLPILTFPVPLIPQKSAKSKSHFLVQKQNTTCIRT